MRDSKSGDSDRGNMERLGESAGAMAGRAADFGMEVTGAMFQAAGQMLGGWWSSDAPGKAATDWSDRAEKDCRSHFQGHAGGNARPGSASASSGTNVAPKSQHAAMQSAGEMASDTGGDAGTTGFRAAAQVRDTQLTGAAHVDTSSNPGSMDSASDGFERARPGYQLGYVARRNPAYSGRSFSDIEPELQRVWESRATTKGSASTSAGSWPEVRGFVDFAYQQGE